MANRTAWAAGNGVGLTWTSCFTGSDIASLASGSTILSASSAITNGTALDIYADISVELTIGSATPSSGGYIGIYLAALLADGTTYGDGSMTSGGSAIARAPPFSPVGIVPLESAAATTLLAGFIQGIIIPPGTFLFGLYNNSGITLSATGGNNVVKYRTYNQNLNN